MAITIFGFFVYMLSCAKHFYHPTFQPSGAFPGHAPPPSWTFGHAHFEMCGFTLLHAFSADRSSFFRQLKISEDYFYRFESQATESMFKYFKSLLNYSIVPNSSAF